VLRRLYLAARARVAIDPVTIDLREVWFAALRELDHPFRGGAVKRACVTGQ